jgi:hypothetical protein
MELKQGRVLTAVAAAWLLAAPQGTLAAGKSRLPPAVAKAVEANKPGAEIDKLEIEHEAGITLYDIEFKGTAGEIEVAEDGTVLDVVDLIDMKDVPAPAAAVIERAARGGGIKRLEKSEVRAKITREGSKGTLAALPTPEYVYEAELVKGGEIEVAADGTIIKAPKFMGSASAQPR